MISTPSTNFGYSATVRLELHVESSSWELAKVGPSEITLREPIALDPCEATLVMIVDGDASELRIRLPLGACTESPRVPIEVLRAAGHHVTPLPELLTPATDEWWRSASDL